MTKGVLFHLAGQCSCTQVCGCNGCCAWLWLWTGWSPSIFSWYGTNMKKHLVGNEYRTDDEICSWGLFLGSGWELLVSQEFKYYNTDGRSVWTTGETMLKNKPHLIKFDQCIIISIWTFQPTLVSVFSLGVMPSNFSGHPSPPLPNPAGTNTACHQMMSSAFSTNEAERLFLPHTGHSDSRLHTVRTMIL